MCCLHFLTVGGDEGSFVFELTDKVNVQSHHVTFAVQVKPIDLSLRNLKKLQVFPRMQAIVSSEHLKVAASGTVPSDGILFEVKKTPTHGKLLIKQAESFDHVTEFSQEEVDNNMILYQSIGRQYVNDTMIFHVTNEYAQKSLTVKLLIEVSGKISKENLHGIVKPVEVAEGGRAIISEVNINITALLNLIPSADDGYSASDTVLIIFSEPQHGIVICHDQKVEPCELTAKDLHDGKLVYQHDHSDTFADSIEFTVKLMEDARTVVDLVNITLDIDVIPVNDNDFKLVTIAPKIDVVFGMKTKLTRQHLYTEDPDGMLDALTYEVISSPNNGRFDMNDGTKVMTVRKFSQKDVDDGKVYFVHDGRTVSKGIFNIKVWDGSPSHKSVYKGCAVNILPLTLSIVNRTEVELMQGTTIVALSREHIMVQTNGNRSNTVYKIEVHPTFGEIAVGNKRVDSFSQQDLDDQRVMYLQMDLSGYLDNVTLTIVNMIAELPNQVNTVLSNSQEEHTVLGQIPKMFTILLFQDIAAFPF